MLASTEHYDYGEVDLIKKLSKKESKNYRQKKVKSVGLHTTDIYAANIQHQSKRHNTHRIDFFKSTGNNFTHY